jgi:pyruvate dehydrogenase E2 component (dihydrolipoamide acetyltransferase)
MAEVILMPRLSDTMTEGVIAAWHKKVGDTVKKGDLLAEIETDKATMELESYQQGVLLHVGTPRGGKLQVNDLLAIIGTAGEDVSALVAQNTNSVSETKAAPENTKVETPAAPVVASADTIDFSKMEEVVLMPRLSDTMTEGVIAGWQKKVGDSVKKGEILADIETDKATMELESYKDGILLYQGAQAGEKILVNQLLCIIGQPGLDIDAIVKSVKTSSDSPAAVAPIAQESKTALAPTAAPIVVAPVAPAASVVNEGRIFASPLAKKIAKEKGVDLKLSLIHI